MTRNRKGPNRRVFGIDGSMPLAFIAILAIGILLGVNLPSMIDGKNTNNGARQELENQLKPTDIFPSPKAATHLTIAIPAVDKDGMGKLAHIQATFTSGSGKTSIETGNGFPLISPETQESVNMAVALARKISGNKSSSLKDASFQFTGKSEIVTGRSAGAAIAVISLAGFEGKRVRNDTLITGSITEDGEIGRVGFIQEKALALNGTSYATLIVPTGEKIQDGPEGLRIIEIANLTEAYELFIDR